jgi:hypothetical protein
MMETSKARGDASRSPGFLIDLGLPFGAFLFSPRGDFSARYATVERSRRCQATAKGNARRFARKFQVRASIARMDAKGSPGRGSGSPWCGWKLASCAATGLPTTLLRDRKRQYRRKPSRCQRTAVSGFTIRSGFDHLGHTRRSMTQNNRPERRRRARLVRRLNTTSCCLRATISSPKSCRDRIKLLSHVNQPKISQSMNPFL